MYVPNELYFHVARRENREMVELLMKDRRVDPSDQSNYALEIAMNEGYSEIVDLLLRDPQVASKAISRASKNPF